eukprot:2866444-Rhodomonas_salina.1
MWKKKRAGCWSRGREEEASDEGVGGWRMEKKREREQRRREGEEERKGTWRSGTNTSFLAGL